MNSNPPKKEKFLDRLAEDNGVAIVVVNKDSKEISVSNNNSMCRSLSASVEFAPRCAEFCGKAFASATEAGKPVDYECYAGLTCRAVPVWDGGTQFVAIVGRTFLKAENYRSATENAITGEWRQFRPTEFFENVLISGSDESLDKTCSRLEKFSYCERNDILEIEQLKLEDPKAKESTQVAKDAAQPDPKEITDLINKFKTETEKAAGELRAATAVDVQKDPKAAGEWRSLFGSLMKLEYRDACKKILSYLKDRYALDSLVWLERRGDNLEVLVALGALADKAVKIGISAGNQRLADAARREMPLEFRERRKVGGIDQERTLSIFPVTIGNDIRGAIGIDSRIENPEQKRLIARFAQTLASQLEILRLRDEVAQRDWLSQAVVRFNESLRRIDADDFWLKVTQISAELLGAERASILIHNEKSNTLRAKAAIGSRINLLSEAAVGVRVAGRILEIGNPVIVSDIANVGMESAPSDWSYKTNSFISYPILIGDRKVGVLNYTDKADGDRFSNRDLELLQAIAPQIAVAIDRTTLKDKAGEYEQLSVTDPLTGLLNRRYLEERLAEEITRSKRHRFSMSLMMLDVDDFKSYNDSFGHPAGDSALKTVADVLQETLRGADVAARYGGEEFAILLPQTSSEEAAQIGERIRSRIESSAFPGRQVTVSIGIAACSNEIDSPKDLISAADVALYSAKNNGRNNVQIFSTLGDSVSNNVH